MYADIIEFKWASRHIYTICKPCVQDQPRLQNTSRPFQGFGGTLEKGFISGKRGNKGQILNGSGEQRQYLETGNLRKQIFDFGGTGEQANLFQGNKRTGAYWVSICPIKRTVLEKAHFEKVC